MPGTTPEITTKIHRKPRHPKPLPWSQVTLENIREARISQLRRKAYTVDDSYRCVRELLNFATPRVPAMDGGTVVRMVGGWDTHYTDLSDPESAYFVYVVYSYGTHYPLWLYCATTQRWYGNSKKYSRTTTRQQDGTRPSEVYEYLSCQDLKLLDDDRGPVGRFVKLLARAPAKVA